MMMHDGHHDHDHCGCGCGHDHDHDHCASCGDTASQGNETIALLDYMLKHNQHHTAELGDVKTQLETMGKTEAAKQLDAVIDDYSKGNVRLAAILATLKE